MASAKPLPLSRPGLHGLGAQLREMFHEMVSGPMPDHLVDLVDQLEAQGATVSNEAAQETVRPATGIGS
jgi:hypothetical protein